MIQALRVSIADDHPVFLGGLEALLRDRQEFHVVSVDADGTSAIGSIRRLTPDIAVLDVAMPGLTGIQVLKLASSEQLPTRIVFLTASLTNQDVLDAVEWGAWGIVLKEAAADTLVQCLMQVAQGTRWLSSELINSAAERLSERRQNVGKFETLTTREREIALLVADGLSNKEIARHFNISDGTVKIHLYNAYYKVGVANRASLAALVRAYIGST
ncbi:response regulator [Microvirga sesbaniae]|uniref:response regulator n=1 Tax=Microvirga sesbaniae TaxID=681392 RepID=UPI0021CA6D04|nr:response regulator transcription factor [Microvirga sp. HBU67692]